MIVALKFVPPGVDVVASFRKTSGSNLRRSNSSSSKKGSLLILVKEAKNLLTPKGSGTPDPFVKWYFLFSSFKQDFLFVILGRSKFITFKSCVGLKGFTFHRFWIFPISFTVYFKNVLS